MRDGHPAAAARRPERDGVSDDLVSVAAEGFEVAGRLGEPGVPETYLGLRAGAELRVASGASATSPSLRRAGSAEPQPVGARRGLDGRERASVLNEAGGRIAFRFHARDVNLVMGPREGGSSVRSVCASTESRRVTRTGSTWTKRATER